jgi:hypothetical protein
MILIINVVLGVFIFFLLIVLWWVWPPDSPWSPWWRTNTKKSEAGGELADINSKDTVYELGSGDANFLVAVSKKFGAKGVGIEIDPLRHLTGKLNVVKNKLAHKIVLKKGNFFNFNLGNATVVFVYLVPRVLEKLKPKLIAELKKGTKIVSYKYKFKENKKIKFIATDKKSEMYLYKVI